MSEEMAVSDNTTGDEAKVSNDEATTATVAEPEEAAVEAPIVPVVSTDEEPPPLVEEDPRPEIELNIEKVAEKQPEVKTEPESDEIEVPIETPEADIDIKKEEEDEVKDEIETFEHNIEEVLKRGIKRRASSAFSDAGGDEEFKGFDEIKHEVKPTDYCRILERLEAEVTAASKDLVPLRTVMATPPAPGRASKRPRKDTDGSRPSSALSTRSDGDGGTDVLPDRKLENMNGRKRTNLKHAEETLTQTGLKGGKKQEIGESCHQNCVHGSTVQNRPSSMTTEQPQIEEDPERIEVILGIDDEQKIVEWIKELAERGLSVTKEALLRSITMLIRDMGKENRFTDFRLRLIWYSKFLFKHRDIHIHYPEFNKAHEVPRESLIKKWFTDLESFLTKRGMTDIMEDPNRIFNADETAFSLTRSGKVLAPKSIQNFTRENEKVLSVFIMMSAAGTVCPPCVIYPCSIPDKAFVENMPGDWLIGRNKLGRMSLPIFYEYFANGFNEWLVTNNVKKPVIVFIDGQKSHNNLSMILTNFCEENGIILYSLPQGNITNILQPSEVSVFKPLNQKWRLTRRNWQEKLKNFNQPVTKMNFPKLLKGIFDTRMSQAIKNGFRNSGLFPFNVDAVDFTKCLESQERMIQESLASRGLTKGDFEKAAQVIYLIEDRLKNRRINPDVVSEEICFAKYSFFKKGQTTEDVNSPEQAYRDTRTTNMDTAGGGDSVE